MLLFVSLFHFVCFLCVNYRSLSIAMKLFHVVLNNHSTKDQTPDVSCTVTLEGILFVNMVY